MAKRPTGFLPFILVPTTLAAGAFLAAPYFQGSGSPDVEETATADPSADESSGVEDSEPHSVEESNSDSAAISTEVANADSSDSMTSDQADAGEKSQSSDNDESTMARTDDQIVDGEGEDSDKTEGVEVAANETPRSDANESVEASDENDSSRAQSLVEMPVTPDADVETSTVAPLQRPRIDFSRSALLSVNSTPAPMPRPLATQRIRVMKPVTQPSNQPFPVQVEIEPATEAVMPATVEGVEPEDAKEQAENNAGNSNGPESTRSERLEQKETGEDSGKEESEQEVSGEKVAQQSSNGRVESVEQPRSSGYSIYSPATN